MTRVIGFIDESGDAGRKPGQGSSTHFVLALVLFPERSEAERCGVLMEEVRLRLGLKTQGRFEFHFRQDSDTTRRAVLAAVAACDFTYYASVLTKTPGAVPPPAVLYSLAAARLFGACTAELQRAIITVDGSGSRAFKRDFAGTIRTQAAAFSGARIEVRVQRSESHALIQLADYVAGVLNRGAEGKRGADEYRAFIARREGAVANWQL